MAHVVLINVVAAFSGFADKKTYGRFPGKGKVTVITRCSVVKNYATFSFRSFSLSFLSKIALFE